MIAILLCAGFATRMHPLTENFPKPLLEIGGRAVLDYLADQIIGFRDLDSIYVVTNNRFFHRFVAWGERREAEITERGISLHIYNDGAKSARDRLGAVGDLGFVLNSAQQNEGALVAAGDNIFLFDLTPYWEKFLQDDKSYIFALPTDDAERLRRTGVVELGPERRVTAFHEKPEHQPTNLACPALYFLRTGALKLVSEYLSRPEAGDEIGHLISYLVERGRIYAFEAEGEAIDIGTVESYEKAKELLSNETAVPPKQE